MNIVEALRAAQERGLTAIAIDYPGGFRLIRPTNTRNHIEMAYFPYGYTGSPVFNNYSPTHDELLSERWYLRHSLSGKAKMATDELLDMMNDPFDDGPEIEPVKYDPEIKECHGFKVGSIAELVPTGETVHIIGFSSKMAPCDIVASVGNHNNYCYVRADNLRHIGAPEPDYEIPAPPKLSAPAADKTIIDSEKEDKPVSTEMNPVFLESHTSRKFKDAVIFASEKELQIAQIHLVAKRDIGEKVVKRLEAVTHELKRRHAAEKKAAKLASQRATRREKAKR